MRSFNNVLAVIAEDEVTLENPALVRAQALTESGEANLTLMGVVRPAEKTVSALKNIFKPDELVTMLAERFEQKLLALAEKLDIPGRVEVRIATGRDFIEIIRQVVFARHDVVIKTVNHLGESFDSSDLHLMRKCPAPVWLVKTHALKSSGKVLAAVDLQLQNDEEGRALNHAIMSVASRIASNEGAPLHVLSCWSLYGENTLRDSGFVKISKEELASLLDEEEAACRDTQRALIDEFNDVPITTHLEKGSAAELIPAFASDNAVGTVVMGTVARTGIPGLLIGNTAETILHKLDASVVTLKPAGFESIIK